MINIITHLTYLYIAKKYNISFFSFEHDFIKEQSLKVRHSVYVKELKYEQGENIETDKFDKHSIGCVITDKSTQEAIATVRLILGNKSFHLPTLDHLHNSSLQIDIQKYTEVSRLSIIKEYRNQKSKFFKTPISLVLLVLYLSVIYLAHKNKIDNIIFMTEKKLALQLKKIGVPIETDFKTPIHHKKIRYCSIVKTEDIVKFIEASKIFIIYKKLFQKF